jgi:hypothetical protein
MQSLPGDPGGTHQPQTDIDDFDCPALLDLEGNFIASFLCDAVPNEPLDASPYPYASYQPDSSRVLTRLTQRLVLDINTRKQGHDAYASSSSDDEGEMQGCPPLAAKAKVGGSSAQSARAAGKMTSATRPERAVTVEERHRTKAKMHLAASVDDEEELDGFVVDDDAEVSE